VKVLVDANLSPAWTDLLARRLKTFGVLVGVLLGYGVMAMWSQRVSLLYLAIPASVTLAVAFWTRVQARTLTAAVFALAVACAVSPIDLEVHWRTADPWFRVLPVATGSTASSAPVAGDASSLAMPRDTS
jgi:hypothetical protein